MSSILAAGAARMKLEAENYEPRIVTLEAQLAKLAAENERLKQRLADHPRATSTVDAHETANVSDKPEGQQEPVAWEGYWPGAGSINSVTKYTRSKLAAIRWEGDGAIVKPLFTRPSEQAVTEAMVEAATEEYFAASFKNTPSGAMRMALKAAMGAGR